MILNKCLMMQCRRVLLSALTFISIAALAACGESNEGVEVGLSVEERDLLANEAGIGEVNEPLVYDDKSDSFSHNGEFDYSEFCKPIPDLAPLVDPEIIVSMDGLTLRLRDRAGDYNQVFPIGVGKKDSNGQSITPLSTNSPGGVFYLRADRPAVVDGATASTRRWAYNYSCRIWSGFAYDNDLTGMKEHRSYFAGLPFIRLEGPPSLAYGIHGPITNYWREHGGDLIQGYVSGGCIRMAANDIVELFALVQGHRVPVRVQPEVDDSDGLWIGQSCERNEDCESGQCLQAGEGPGICSEPCERYCPDRIGHPMTRCIGALDGSLEGGSCTIRCVSDANCPTGTICSEESFYGRLGSDSVCVPE